MTQATCHCGNSTAYEGCCEPCILGKLTPTSAEQLMRSRYSAFVECNETYLLASWHPCSRPSRVRFDPQQRWLGLSIKATDAGCESDTSGTVEFVARYKVDGKGHRLRERSRFEKVDGCWFYLDGDHLQ